MRTRQRARVQKRKASETESSESISSSEQDEDEDAEQDAAKAPVSPRPRNMERWPGGPGWNNGKRVLPPRPYPATTTSQAAPSFSVLAHQPPTAAQLIKGEDRLPLRKMAEKGPPANAIHVSRFPAAQLLPSALQQQGVAVHNRPAYVTDAGGRGITPRYICINLYIQIYILYIYYIYTYIQ